MGEVNVIKKDPHLPSGHPLPIKEGERYSVPAIRILGQRVDQVTFAVALEHIRRFLNSSDPHQIITANTLMLLAAEQDPELSHILERASLVVPESWGVCWAGRHLGTPFDEMIPGIDLLQGLCCLAAEGACPVYLLGAQPGVAERAGATLRNLFPGLRIVGTHHGYFTTNPPLLPPLQKGGAGGFYDPGNYNDEEVAVIQEIQKAAPAILFVARSVPGQEIWVHRNLDALGARVVMGVGGSFDVLSGRLRRAPAWMRDSGLEWLFRTLQEPWRIRRILQLPVFMWKVLRADYIEGKHITTSPSPPQGFGGRANDSVARRGEVEADHREGRG